MPLMVGIADAEMRERPKVRTRVRSMVKCVMYMMTLVDFVRI